MSALKRVTRSNKKQTAGCWVQVWKSESGRMQGQFEWEGKVGRFSGTSPGALAKGAIGTSEWRDPFWSLPVDRGARVGNPYSASHWLLGPVGLDH